MTLQSPHPEFAGRQRLLDGIDAALQASDTHSTVAQVQAVLERAIRDPQIVLPACVHAPVHDHYARREIYRSPEHGYSIIAMTWGPGQGTPLHDHDGLWCVEGVWQGTLRITPYRLCEDHGDIARLQPLAAVDGARGSAGNLIPPDEFHVLCNASDDEIAISVHVYQGPMEHCTVFVPEPGIADGYRRERRVLRTDTQ